MERAAEAKTWMSCRAQSAPLALPAARGGVAGQQRRSDQLPEGPRAGPTRARASLLDRSGRELSGAHPVGKGRVVAIRLI